MATVENSVLRTEMAGLESQEEDAPKRIHFFKPRMSWLGQIRPHRRHETWSVSLWQTFFAMTMGKLGMADSKYVTLKFDDLLWITLLRYLKYLFICILTKVLSIVPRTDNYSSTRGRAK